jgi:ankyrin repeat protein
MQTALHIASDYDYKDLIDILIDRGAELEAKNKVTDAHVLMSLNLLNQ